MLHYRPLGKVLGTDRCGRRVPRVLLHCEALWRLPVPGSAADYGMLLDRRGALVTAGYTVYADARTPIEFEDSVMPLLRGVSHSRCRFFLGLLATPATMRVSAMARTIDQCRHLGIATVLELRGSWSTAALALLAMTRPDYVRLGPDLVRGIAVVPEQFRAVVQVSEFARDVGLPLVARGLDSTEDLDAVRIAGIGLVHRGQGAGRVDELLFAASAGEVPSAVVLDFPLRPFPSEG